MRSVFLLRHSDQPLQMSKTELLADMDWELAGHAQRWREARDLLPLLHPDVLVTDLRVLDGAVTRLIQQMRHRKMRVLLLVGGVDEPLLLDALLSGAHGYHLDSPKGGGLIAALEDVVEGRARLSPALARQLLQRTGTARLSATAASLRSMALDASSTGLLRTLSVAHQALLSLLSHGWLQTEIALAWQVEVAEIERRTAQALRLAQQLGPSQDSATTDLIAQAA